MTHFNNHLLLYAYIPLKLALMASEGQNHLKIKVKFKEINFLSIINVFVIYLLHGWYAFD